MHPFVFLLPLSLPWLTAARLFDGLQVPLSGDHSTLSPPDQPEDLFTCDGLTSASFNIPNHGNYKPVLERLPGGTNGCAYKFAPGWPTNNCGATAAKTPNDEGRSYPDDPERPNQSEAGILRRIEELCAHTKDISGRDWLVTKMHPGQWLTSTGAYKKMIESQNPDICRPFYQNAYKAVFTNVKYYIDRYGCAHKGGTEMNEANVLLEVAENGAITAHVVDWAAADCSNGNKEPAESLRLARQLCADYAYYGPEPPNWCGLTVPQAETYCKGLQ
ncbi:hypothetical protein R3P38DRAFT_3229555 [Favolaschia claudopus]|uniref:Uncharacterized protein n=1 Tax=Favolaschia claudopus TaxID=2862362 RepID=A0AAV9ZNR5_9AGAR